MSSNDGSRFREVFQHLNRTWEELRLADLDLPLVHDLRRLHEELSAGSEHLGNGADLAAFGWKCAKFGAGLQEATIRLFLPAQFQEQLDDLAGEFRVNDIRMENRMDDIEQRLREAPDRPNDDDAVPRLRRRVERLRTEMRELQETLYAQENEVANLQAEVTNLRASVVEIPVLREDVRYLRHELHKLKRPDSPSLRRRSPSPRRRSPSPRRRREDSRPRHRSDSVRSRHHHRDESREPRRRHRDETPKPRRMIELSPPPKFSGTDKKVLFANWWRQVIQYLDSQPPGAVGDDKRKISWVSSRLVEEADIWYWDWKEQAEKPFSTVPYTWEQFQADIKKRFTDTREDVRAWRELRKLSYTDDIHGFLTKWDGLCAKAGVHGTVYRDMLLRAVGPAVRGKMENVAPADTDEGLREQVLNAGRIVELWADTRAHERDLGYRRPERTDPRTNRDHRTSNNTRPAPSATTSTTAAAGSTRDRPTGTTGQPRQPRRTYERKFRTIEEAVSGVPPEVVQARRETGDCLRCGYKKGASGEHSALYCVREPDTRMPRQIAAVEAGKRDREDDDLEEDVMDKRPRMEVAAVDMQMPLYEDAGYDSDHWESD
jgi:hypothetical protein